ncbi:hypothetical protein [Arenimonas oryziterrae]|uniref:Uncharacterized protein n=1 Tax=Arenimonas oryziterrae DSM 21050 = YC6267 TaxID=1121015 RepID=A0A091ASL1_9GAMM|nr:hypothetical protein [Arenimonas oryziterrae]KFN42351.1 hypothetical protein N789_14270 [Arenimonas oryziterrae DSM 21050 = YC6267]
MQFEEYKKGSEFDWLVVARNKAKETVPLDGYTIKSQIRKWERGCATAKIADLTCEQLEEEGQCHAFVEEVLATMDWPVCKAVVDIVLIPPSGARITHRGFKYIDIIEGATQEDPR